MEMQPTSGQQPAIVQPVPREPRRPASQEAGQQVHREDTIYVGKKGVMSYVLAVVTQFNNGKNEVRVKARGRSISTAVDVSQIVKNRFMPTIAFKQVNLSTEELQSEDGSMAKVSSIEIVLSK